MGDAAIMIFNMLGGLYLAAVVLRFLLQLSRADFYNPLSQAIVRVTDPPVRAFRMFIPGWRGLDFSCLALALALEAAFICALLLLYGAPVPGAGFVVTWALVGVVYVIGRIYFYAIIAAIIMSFMAAFSGGVGPHPLMRVVLQLTEPVMSPVRRIIPPLGGLDFSPLVIFMAMYLADDLLRGALGITAVHAAVVIGI